MSFDYPPSPSTIHVVYGYASVKVAFRPQTITNTAPFWPKCVSHMLAFLENKTKKDLLTIIP